jgi:hypothetical protein
MDVSVTRVILKCLILTRLESVPHLQRLSPLIPAKAGIQFLSKLGPRFRADERERASRLG